jgi:transcriptional regulator with XRE-family HTH domain
MPNALTGTLIRERRLSLGLKQADLALAAGISASYLNLIEHNRRRIGVEGLERLATALGVDPSALSEGAGGALVDDLRAAAALSLSEAEVDRIEDFAGRFPGWATALAGQHRRVAQLERMVAALNDRLTHDPYLSAALHEVLSAVSSVRSTAAILVDTDDIDPEWRQRFHRNLHEDSERLAAGAEALVAYLDGSDATDDQAIASPQEEVEAWLAQRGWHLAELEQPGGLTLIQGEVEALASSAARSLAGEFLEQAMRDAQILPQARLLALLQAHQDDPALVAQAARLPVLTVMRRMALLPGARAGLVVCDASGTMLFRKPVDGFTLPRFGAACPLWPLFVALGRPMAPVSMVIEAAGRAQHQFRALAMCETRLPSGFAGTELREAAMLLLPLAPGTRAEPVVAVGSSCRICPRARCPARREPSILAEAV